MEEIIEKISQIIRREFDNSVCAGNLDTDKISKEIWKWLLNAGKIKIQIPEAASGCCEITD